MAFEMYAGDTREVIGPQDEFIFLHVAKDPSRYPQLAAIWASFYDDPSVSPPQSGALVHELIDLLACHGGASNKPLTSVVVRLLVFFSMAFQEQTEVRCVSD